VHDVTTREGESRDIAREKGSGDRIRWRGKGVWAGFSQERGNREKTKGKWGVEH
jgi:hypothetical protein